MNQTHTKVLIVDDDPDVREIVAVVLRLYGVPSETACDGGEALQLLRRANEVGLVLLDVMMPKMNGIEVLRELRRDGILASLPVVVISGNCDAELTALELGAKTCLLKPLEIDHLMQQVSRYVPVPTAPTRSVAMDACKTT